MDIFETLILDMMLLQFPIFMWLFCIMYNKNIGRKENDLFFDFALITSLYLVIKFGKPDLYGIPFIIINIPLIVSYIRKRELSTVLLSILLIIYSYYYFIDNIVILVIEYLLYYITYLLLIKKRNNTNYFLLTVILIKTVLFTFTIIYYNSFDYTNINEIINLIFLLLISVVVCYFVVKLCDYGEEVLKYHMNIKELEQEKQIRMSLFKITHEIKNPIAVCKGYLDMFDVNNINHSQKYVPILKEEIERTLILLQDFLCMTKIKIDLEIVDINMVLEDVLDNFKQLFKEQNIKLSLDINEDSIYIMGDYNRLTQVFINLIKNSVEAKDENKNSFIKVYTELQEKSIKIFIADNGIGISEKELKKIEEPFYTTKKHGTGLGVSLAKEVIEGHNGKIKYTSTLGSGTTVEITLPLK